MAEEDIRATETKRAGTTIDMTESMIWNNVDGPCTRLARSLYYSSACRFIYLFLLAYNCGLAVWAIHDLLAQSKPDFVFYVFESAINAVLALDVMMRLWLKGCYNFWREWTNVFEFFIVGACLIITALSIVGTAGLTCG